MDRPTIDAETPRKDLERHVMAADPTSGRDTITLAAESKAELWRRDREAEQAETARQLEIANKQLETSKKAMWAATASAIMAIGLLILTATQIFSS